MGRYQHIISQRTWLPACGSDSHALAFASRILLPPDYPFKPPHIVFLTPSGRFETNKKVCLSFSAFHPELWQPAWGIRLILEALIAFLPSPADGAIGALDWSPAERKRLAAKSRDFCCPLCGKVANLLPPSKETASPTKPSRFQKEIEQLQLMQTQEHKKNEVDGDKNMDASQQNPSPSVTVTDSEGTADTKPSPSNEPGAAVSSFVTSDAEGNDRDDAEGNEKDDAGTEAFNAGQGSSTDLLGTQPADTPDVPALDEPDVAADLEAPETAKPSWLVEQTVHMAIAVLSVVCFLLIRKIQALCVELQALEE